MFCGECGSKLEDSARFCGECGHVIVSHGERADTNTANHKTSYQNAVRSGVQVFQQIFRNKKGLWDTAITVAILLLLYFLITAHQNSPVSALKDMVFDQYGTAAFGTVVKQRVNNAQWDSSKIGEKHHQVSLKGFLREYRTNFTLRFDVTYAGEWIYADPISVTVQGETYTDWLDIVLFFGMLYG